MKPVTSANTKSIPITFPSGVFYDLQNLEIAHFGTLETKTVSAPLEKLPAYIAGGHIITRKDQYRRSSRLMQNDPYTLVIAPTAYGTAKGRLYVDDGETFAYKQGKFLEVELEYNKNVIYGTVLHKDTSSFFNDISIEKIVIAHHPDGKVAETCTLELDDIRTNIEVIHEDHSHVIKNPGIQIGQDWKIIL